MKITVIGAGAIGSAVAQTLQKRNDVARVQVCDASARSLEALHEEATPGSKLRSFQVDARDPSVLDSILKGSDCVVGCVPPKINPNLAELCLSLGIHYCDLGGNDAIVQQQLALNEEAQKKSVWIVPNCGLAPGLTNVLCLHGIEQFDEVEAAHLRVGDVPLYPEPPFNFGIAWSADKVIEDYTNPVQWIDEGKVQEGEPLTEDEAIHFAEPFGTMEAFFTQGGLSTLTEALTGRVRRLDHKTIRWPGHASQMRFVLALGFGEQRKIDVRTHLTYRDVLLRRMRQRLGGEHEDAVLLRVLIKGKQNGQERSLVYELIERYDEETGETAIKRCTSIPTATVATFIASKRVPGGGAAPPEDVLPREEYLRAIEEQGLKVNTYWHDGYVDITRPGLVTTSDAA